MTVTYPTVNEIFKTLPIGYYLGRNIDCELHETDNSSYFQPAADKIVVSYPMISDAFSRCEKGDNLESIIRGLLYHEISHAILTPKTLEVDDIINIFEDERIETILRKTYLNTDFYRNLILINNYKGGEPTDIKEAFYHLVRFHKGEEYWLNRVTEIINKYDGHTLNASTASFAVNNYYAEVATLWYDFSREKKEEKKRQPSNESPMDEQSNMEGSANGKGISIENNSSHNISNEATSSEDGGMNGDKNQPSEHSSLAGDGYNEEYAGVEEGYTHENTELPGIECELTLEAFREIAESVIGQYRNNAMLMKLTAIVDGATKKNKKNGTAINSYSGKLNPRSVVREDYRWWVQQNRAGHIKQFSNVHFNLFIDNSGSFYLNDFITNQLIQSLKVIEKQNKQFTFDVITINDTIVEWDRKKAELFKSHGGNILDDSIKPVIQRHQMKNAANYNLVLFDGDAHSDEWSICKKEAFSYFDLPNTFIISDYSNEKYIEKAKLTKARVTFTRNYVDEFINKLFILLERAM